MLKFKIKLGKRQTNLIVIYQMYFEWKHHLGFSVLYCTLSVLQCPLHVLLATQTYRTDNSKITILTQLEHKNYNKLDNANADQFKEGSYVKKWGNLSSPVTGFAGRI